MCFYSKITSDALTIANRFKVRIEDINSYSPKEIVNAFDFGKNPVITNDNPSLVQFYNWGVIPFGNQDINIRKYTLNAKIETINSVKSFRDIVHNRCLIPANGFYEWKHVYSSGKRLKEKYLVTTLEEELFAFAGLYSKWSDKGKLFETYTILTTHANELMSVIHNSKKRMPVIIRKEDEQDWINGRDISEFSFPYQVNLVANICRDENEQGLLF